MSRQPDGDTTYSVIAPRPSHESASRSCHDTVCAAARAARLHRDRVGRHDLVVAGGGHTAQSSPARGRAAVSRDRRALRLWLHRLYLPLHDYSVAALTVTQLFAVRLAVLLLALPAFAVFGLVGLCDGLVERDLRRWGGGRESSWRYHQAKRLVLPLLGVGGLVYLALPRDVTPGFVIVPFAMLFGLALAIMASTFKIYQCWEPQHEIHHALSPLVRPSS